jgi:PadR family transcriptional regulator PadR
MMCRVSRHTPKTDLLQGTLDLLILQVVSLGPQHGYAIAQRLNRISKEVLQIHQGSLYPALHRLEKRRWLRSEWRISDSGREAKFYTLTAKGGARLQAERGEWARLSQAIALVLETAK